MRYQTPSALEMAVKSAAQASPLDTGLAVSSFYFHRLLCRVFSAKDSPFVLKGGLSVLARTVDARATRDIDLLARETNLDAALEELKHLASIDLGDFVFFLFEKAEPIKTDDEYRHGTKAWFIPMLGGKSLQPISIDLVVDEIGGLEPEIVTPADRLDIDGLPVYDYRIYRVECALADKLLAITEMHDGRPSSRVKDLADIVVYAKTCEVDGRTLVEQVIREAAARKIVLPDCFTVPEAWMVNYNTAYAKMARQAKIDGIAGDLNSAQQIARKLYMPVFERTHTHARWNPACMRWLETS